MGIDLYFRGQSIHAHSGAFSLHATAHRHAARQDYRRPLGRDGRCRDYETFAGLRANEVVHSLAEAVAQLAEFCVTITDEMIPAPLPANEEERMATLATLDLLDAARSERLDRITEKVARVFEVPMHSSI